METVLGWFDSLVVVARGGSWIENYRVDHLEIFQVVTSRLKSDTLKNYNHTMRRQSCEALRISVITE